MNLLYKCESQTHGENLGYIWPLGTLTVPLTPLPVVPWSSVEAYKGEAWKGSKRAKAKQKLDNQPQGVRKEETKKESCRVYWVNSSS